MAEPGQLTPAEKQHRNGGEYGDQDNAFATLRYRTDGDGEEDAGQQEGQGEKCDIERMTHLGEVEQMRHHAQFVGRDGNVDDEERRCAPK